MDLPAFKNEYHIKGEDLLPHRPPFLFVDELVSADETGGLGRYTYTVEKNDFFKGHFPDYPVVPGVVLVESMAQVAGAALVATGLIKSNGGFALLAIESAKFRRPLVPGDTLTTVALNTKLGARGGRFSLKGYVDGTLAAEASVMCLVKPPEKA